MTVTHVANDLPIINDGRECGDCHHYDRALSRCLASKDLPTVGPDWAACTRFLPHGPLGHVLAYVKRHPLVFALPGLFTLFGYPLSQLLR